MDLADLAGQQPQNSLLHGEYDIRDGFLPISQGKCNKADPLNILRKWVLFAEIRPQILQQIKTSERHMAEGSRSRTDLRMSDIPNWV